jgi:hypothetical protein
LPPPTCTSSTCVPIFGTKAWGSTCSAHVVT